MSSDYSSSSELDPADEDLYDELYETAEPLEQYHPGRDAHGRELYYPVCIGETLNSKYRVEHKLGYGGFSTVWLARCLQDTKLVALKIMVPGDVGENEKRMQDAILKTVRDPSRLVTYLDTFTLDGYEGKKHRVLVFPARGPSLQSCLKEMPMQSRMSAAKQSLEALESLHRSGFVHRDLNSGSIMWDMDPKVINNTDRPRSLPIKTKWKRGEHVLPMKVQTDSVKDTVYLGDFGLTIKVGDPVKEKWHRPVEYCAPEQFHNEYPSYASDMWSYMCLFAKLSLGVTPFYGNSSNIISSDMTNVLGPMPPEWKGCYEGDGQSDASWYDKSRKPADGRTLRELIGRARKEINDAEADEIESIMKKGFCYSVNDRITAAELLQDDSFKALMRRYQVA